MKTLEKILATALFAVGALSLVAVFWLFALTNYRLLVLVVAVLFIGIGVLSLLYGYVRRTNLQHTPAKPRDRTSPPGQFLVLGWSLLAISLLLFGVKFLWLH